MAFWKAVNVVRLCKHSPNPQGPLSWTPGGVLSFTHPAPSHTKLVSEGSHSCLKCSSVFAYFAHTILPFLTQSAICQYILFILRDWQYELVSPRKSGVLWLAVFFWLVPWRSVTLLLSLKLEFIFYKLEWNVFVFQVIISILLGCCLGWWNKHIKRCAALTKRCGLAGWLAPAFCCKAPAEVTGWQQRAPRHKRVVSAAVEWAGQ